MKFSENLRTDRSGWRRVLVVIAIFSLTVTLATRFSIPPDSHIHAFKSDSNKSGEPKRLDRDAVSYVIPALSFAGFDATPVYAYLPPSSTVGARDVISASLYNRPPPHSFSI
jgi:predicted MFS family arabinose efflux permease